MAKPTLTSINDQIQEIRRVFASLRTARSAFLTGGKNSAEYAYLCELERLAHALAADAEQRREANENH